MNPEGGLREGRKKYSIGYGRKKKARMCDTLITPLNIQAKKRALLGELERGDLIFVPYSFLPFFRSILLDLYAYLITRRKKGNKRVEIFMELTPM